MKKDIKSKKNKAKSRKEMKKKGKQAKRINLTNIRCTVYIDLITTLYDCLLHLENNFS
jgi:hypothetical protein